MTFVSSGPSFRPSLTKTSRCNGTADPSPKSNVSSGSEGSSCGVSRALLPKSECVESASEHVGVFRAHTKSRSSSTSGSLRSKSRVGSGNQAVGSRIQLSSVQKLAFPSEPPPDGSESAEGDSSKRALDSVPSPVHRQNPDKQGQAPI